MSNEKQTNGIVPVEDLVKACDEYPDCVEFKTHKVVDAAGIDYMKLELGTHKVHDIVTVVRQIIRTDRERCRKAWESEHGCIEQVSGIVPVEELVRQGHGLCHNMVVVQVGDRSPSYTMRDDVAAKSIEGDVRKLIEGDRKRCRKAWEKKREEQRALIGVLRDEIISLKHEVTSRRNWQKLAEERAKEIAKLRGAMSWGKDFEVAKIKELNDAEKLVPGDVIGTAKYVYAGKAKPIDYDLDDDDDGYDRDEFRREAALRLLCTGPSEESVPWSVRKAGELIAALDGKAVKDGE